MIAKIAHGAAVATLGVEKFKPLLPPIILGTDKHISHLVGSSPKKLKIKQNATHSIEITLKNRLVIADINLFSGMGYKPYRAVVGEASRELTEWHMSLSYEMQINSMPASLGLHDVCFGETN